MGKIPEHVKWLVDTGERIETADGKIVEVWEFAHQPDDENLSAWARHFRNHYCLDEEIDYFRSDYGYSRKEYLNQLIFPDSKEAPGPGVRAGDFGEILLADYLEFILGYWVPRARYDLKFIGNESSKGCDTIGFIYFHDDEEESSDDVMIICEAKARLTKDHLTNEKSPSGFQAAINDSAKDNLRIGESLNYLKRRFYKEKIFDKAAKIGRFQNPHDRPYKDRYGAAAIFSKKSFILETISSATTDAHPNNDRLFLIIICGEELMDLVHTLYQRAADEA